MLSDTFCGHSASTTGITTTMIKKRQTASSSLQDHKEYAWSVINTSHRAAESLVYTVHAIIKFAGSAAKIGGKKDEYLIGRYLDPGLSLLEAFRVVANWQRHDLDRKEAPFYQKNFNHKALKDLALWGARDVSVKFLKMLRRQSYYQLEADIAGGLEYLVCEFGMKHPKPDEPSPAADP
jgi:hypothetical protein